MKSLKAIVLTALISFMSVAISAQEETDLARMASIEMIEFRQMIENGNCVGLLKHFKSTTQKIQEEASDLYGFMLINGVCFDQNMELAAKVFNDILLTSDRANVYGILGYLYYTGQGVSLDKNKADKLFHLAAITLGSTYLHPSNHRILSKSEPLPNGETIYESLWRINLFKAFGWVQPKSLTDKIETIRKIDDLDNAGAKIYEIAQHLQNGTGGYPKHPVLAFKWIDKAIYPFEFAPALPKAIRWAHSEKMINDRFKFKNEEGFEFKHFDITKGNLRLDNLMNDPKADPRFVAYAHCRYSLLDRELDANYYRNLYIYGSMLKDTKYELPEQQMQYYKYTHLAPVIAGSIYSNSDDLNRSNLNRIERDFNQWVSMGLETRIAGVRGHLYIYTGAQSISSEPRINNERYLSECWDYIDPNAHE